MIFNLTKNNYYNFGKGIINENSDFRIISSSKINLGIYDYLIFTDSKGTSINNEIGFEWTTRLIKKFLKNNISFLLITRPKELTIFFTLINFLKNNQLKFKYLISNLGFVDLTPKKKKFIVDIIHQNPFEYDLLNSTKSLCDYKLSDGKIEKLYSIQYDSFIIEKIAYFLSENFNKCFLIDSFEFNKKINIDRKRPNEFYTQLKITNEFIEKICRSSNTFINIKFDQNKLKKNSHLFSYDAVHFTLEGHDLVFEHLLKQINC